MRVWQIAGRVDELPKVGDWKEYEIHDQSFVIVRGKDEKLRGFVNACRHRGNVLCQGTGNAKRGFLCQYHLWSYDLEGKLKRLLREDVAGPLDKAEHFLHRGAGRHVRRLHLHQPRSQGRTAVGVTW